VASKTSNDILGKKTHEKKTILCIYGSSKKSLHKDLLA